MNRINAPIITPAQPATASGQTEALVLSLACFGANITSAEFDRMSADTRERLRRNIGLSVAQFHAACLFMAEYQRQFGPGLRSIRADDEPIEFDESAPERLQ
jgi:hypothetical protein